MRKVKNKKQLHYLIPFFVLGLFLIDRFLKIAATTGRWFKLHYFENSGIAFSLPISQPIFWVAAAALLVWFIYEYRRKVHVTDFLFELGFYLVLGGLASNALDRIMHGFVVDYFTFGSDLIFNLADVMILIGAIVFGVKLYLYEKE